MQVQVSLTIELAATASLAEMEQQVQDIGQQAMRAAFKQTIRQWEDQQQACPHCGAKQRRLEGTVRRVIATLFGRVQVPRRRFRCLGCGRRWCPANALFAELAGGTVSRPLQEAAWLAGCSWPYRAASAALKRLTGADISAEEIRLLLNRQGKLRAAQQQAEAERVCAAPAQSPAADQDAEQALPVGVDGGWVGSREQRGGMEGKVAVVCAQVADLPRPARSSTFSWSQRGPRQPPKRRHRLLKRRYVATFGPARQLGQLAAAAARRVSEAPAEHVVLLADGAQWIKTEQGRHFPQATCILDWAHLWREVRHAIGVAARATPLSARARDYQLYLHRTWLWYGQVDQALHGLRTLATGLPAEASEAITQAITYLEHQRPWIGSYEHWRKLGYPVGSGMIERAVALVINRRMKKRGMRWCRANATAVVALRTDLLNDDWILPQRLRSFP
jgi:hypothetical protein